MARFTFWESGELPEHDFENHETLSAEEAQAIASIAIAKELQSLNARLSDFFDVVVNHSSIFPNGQQ